MYLNYYKIYNDKKKNLIFPNNVESFDYNLKNCEYEVVYNHEVMSYDQASKICEDDNKVLIVTNELRGYDRYPFGKRYVLDTKHTLCLYNTLSIPKQRYDFIIKNYEYFDLFSPDIPIPNSFLMTMIYGWQEVYEHDGIKDRNYSKIISDYFLHKKKKVMYMWEMGLVIEMMLYDYINHKHYTDKVFIKYFRGQYIPDYKYPFVLKEFKVIDKKMNFSSYMLCLYKIYKYFCRKFKERDTINYYMFILIQKLFYFSIKNMKDFNYLNNITDKYEKSVLVYFTPEFIHNLLYLFPDGDYLDGKIGYHCSHEKVSTKTYKDFVISSKNVYDPSCM